MARESGSFIDEELADRHSDLLFSVVTDVGDALVYLLFEHQSTLDPRMPDRRRPRARERRRARGPHAGRVPKLALWLLRDARYADRIMAGVATWAEKLTEAERAPNGMAALLVLFRYILEVNDQLPWQDFQAKLHEMAPAAEPAAMTIAEQLINKGFTKGLDEGLDKGRAEGRAEGRVGLLTKQLALKFGELTEPWRARLANANVDELDVWAERVLTATTIDQVFADPLVGR